MGEKGKEAVWKEIFCLEGKLILTVPKNWERIVGKKVDGLFPYANQPQMVMGTLEEEKLFTLNLLSKGLEEGQVNGAIREIQRVILRVYPESCRQGIRRRRLKAGITGWFSFSTGGEVSNRRLSQVISADYIRWKYLSQSAVNEVKAFYIGWHRRLSRAYFSSAMAGLK